MTENKEVTLNFTGKMSILAELKGYGPIEFKIHDLDLVLTILKLVLEKSNNTTTVSNYDEDTRKKYEVILNDIT